ARRSVWVVRLHTRAVVPVPALSRRTLVYPRQLDGPAGTPAKARLAHANEAVGPVGSRREARRAAGRRCEGPEGPLRPNAAAPAVRVDRRLLFVDLRRENARYARSLVAEELIIADVEPRVPGVQLLVGDEQRGGSAAPGAAPGAVNVAHRHPGAGWERLGQGRRASGNEQHHRGGSGDGTHGRLDKPCGGAAPRLSEAQGGRPVVGGGYT